MNPSDRATNLATAFSDGLSCLAYLRSLRITPPAASKHDVEEWGAALARMKSGLEDTRTMVQAGEGETSLRVSDELIQRVEDVRAAVAALAPGARLPASLFDRVEVAWTVLGAAM